MATIKLQYSPQENIWYYQKFPGGKVSVKTYGTKTEALKDNPNNPKYKWE